MKIRFNINSSISETVAFGSFSRNFAHVISEELSVDEVSLYIKISVSIVCVIQMHAEIVCTDFSC